LPIGLPNPNAGIDVVRLRDGRFVLIYNHTATGRSPLNLAVSRDGDHWTPFQALESDLGEYSYPAMIQGSDGNLHIAYTWRRERIRYVEWPLTAARRASPRDKIKLPCAFSNFPRSVGPWSIPRSSA
jgi:predicted neuraminidase